ncbi:hypothetical protein BDZ89DRAFT_963373, partial [Hymenopellis radicata]
SEKLKPFLAMQDRIQTIIFDHQYDKLVLEDCDCGSGLKRLYRCTTCKHRCCCAKCVMKAHRYSPFCRLQRWNQLFFELSALCDLGFTLNLGHGGDPCQSVSENNHRRLTIVDVNGYHKVNVVFCRCLSRIQVQNDEAEQLLMARMWPCTVEHPETAITFEVMDNYIMHNNTSKKSAYDYCYALQRLTDPSRPDLVSDVYRHLRLAARVMRKLASRRRSGQEHGIDKYITHRRPGSMSIFCPACPQPGFNIDLEVLAAAKEEERHKYALNLSGDGTFNCPRIKKLDDPNDDALNAGNAYVAEETKFQTYLDVCEGSLRM